MKFLKKKLNGLKNWYLRKNPKAIAYGDFKTEIKELEDPFNSRKKIAKHINKKKEVKKKPLDLPFRDPKTGRFKKNN